ncbi:peptidoglycan glycosyltransferase [Eubacterium sp. AF19-12LB]|uniref:Penicillin-binding transpeptidase domain-containing protein n=2 Tax=Eubacteriaceae TaxID=186806 RepID=A0ABT2LXT2_9FIRM|nr:MULTISPECIES: penicillin-binding transpeptidase domain-containing protein [unclassified Eubacterium (in: firmicutes)]MCT7397668.1 penicillin-binding transpeptidase domain-containing protein [Eubacterium sp. LFL-14]RHR34213.1 peptidoglycan glycosyltransferase [Eubacterium sp. AF19-12LB]
MMLIYVCIIYIMMLGVFGKLVYIMVVKGEYYSQKALDVQERERRIKAARGKILDRNNNVIASNKTVCTVSVIHRQIRDTDAVIKMLCEELDLEEKEVRKKVEKVSVREKIKSNVDKEIGDKIRSYDFDGVKVDEDYKRYYPYSSMASKVLGFTGADNQGIVGLEVKYDKYLQGRDGLILTPTDSRGIELDTALEERVEPVPGYNLVTGIDINIQKYCEQIAYNALGAKQANYVSVIVMNPRNGEIMAMVNAPEFDLNNPYSLTEEFSNDTSGKSKQDLLNNMWRNQCINDTYEPGSTFKIVTATAALSENLVSLDSTFNCPGFVVVDDRRIRCHKTTGHGSQDFVHGTMNSCNPVFVNVGLRVGVKKFYNYMDKLGLLKTTGIDLPGEAGTIIHKQKNVGNVELATMSFGQSFQITPVQFLTAASAIVNGGNLVTPHFGVEIRNENNETVKKLKYNEKKNVISKDVSEKMKYILEKVVAEGTGNKAQVEGYRIGGKTATSQKLPRSARKYIASFMAFAPANDPQVIAMIIVDEPQGVYYGGTVVGPLMKQLYENILPYVVK